MNNQLSRISFIVQENRQFNNIPKILCANSGGQDSILLVLILYHLKRIYHFEFILVYFNHLWQKKNVYSVLHLLKFSYLLNIPICVCVSNLSLKTEQQGHIWRRDNFYHLKNYFDLNTVFVGHTATDQIETALWNLCRGTGSQGLNSLQTRKIFLQKKYSNSIKKLRFYKKKKSNLKFIKKRNQQNFQPFQIKHIRDLRLMQNFQFPYLTRLEIFKTFNIVSNFELTEDKSNFGNFCYRVYFYKSNFFAPQTYLIDRPLLKFYRFSITKIVKANNIPIISDTTNISLKILRNKVRLLLIPFIQNYIHNSAQNNLKHFLDINKVEQEYLFKTIQNLLEFYSNKPTKIKSINLSHIGLQKLVIKNIITHYTDKQVEFNQINNLLFKLHEKKT